MPMNTELTALQKMQNAANQRGNEALTKAKHHIAQKFTQEDPLSEALRHFSSITLSHALPVFPALISLSHDAVADKPKNTSGVGTAILLIAGAADVHDDIIDRTKTKGPNKTVFGKFGAEIATLTGDILLTEGLSMLEKETRKIADGKQDPVLELVTEATFEISKAEAMERLLQGKLDASPKEMLEIINLKASVPKAVMKIGATLGNAQPREEETLGESGSAFGIISLVAEELLDLADAMELKNRLKYECPPLPFLYAMQNADLKTKTNALLESSHFRISNLEKISQIVLNSAETQKLMGEMESLGQNANDLLLKIRNKGIRETLRLFPAASIALLHSLCA